MRIPLDIPPGLVGDDTSFAAAGRWADGSNVRFWRGRPQVIGGWESLTTDGLAGVCRQVFAWTDNAAVLNVAFGSHNALQVWIGGGLYDITPTLARPARRLGADPLSVTAGDATVSVAMVGHGLAGGDLVDVSGAVALGGITPNIEGAPVAVIDADHFTYEFMAPAASSATGGGSAVVVAPQAAFAAGAIDGTGGQGYGTGAFSTGAFSSPSTAEFFPRTWSLSAFGERLVASPRGGTLYAWANDTEVAAEPLRGGPAQVTVSLVSHTDQIFALGCNEEVSGVFNPLCIRHSGVRAPDEWTTAPDTTAREYVLAGGGRIVGGCVAGQFILVWTSDRLFVGTFVGALSQPWRFDPVGEHCGLVGPNAFAVAGSQAVWLAPDLQFRSYSLGGAVQIIACPIRDEMARNLASAQADKVTASTVSIFDEIRFDYPDARDGNENSRYLAVCLGDGSWSKGIMARSAFVDAGPQQDPIGVTPEGRVFWHERGRSADGAAFGWFIESADQLLNEDQTLMVRGLWPDMAGQAGAAALRLSTRLKPQGESRTYGPYPVAPGAGRVDVRASGRLFRVRLSGQGAPTGGRIGRPVFDVVPAGMR
ncbi:hypothetical protein [Phenylobacterium sp.]|uniref:hypothetical protein n=1 Tax=Phenylobacterium sp. TaxID=1871053 RepID=UPI00272F823C|nr:hypothetical protein [Phenylobacterium sp.]MDP1616777.1 hypothetical protein [Phenylobacterium sp.]MDP1988277.1 hypothetical protein [Phenylobacterium sp.]